MVQPTSLPIFMRVQNEGNDSAFERLFIDADKAASRSRESFERNFAEVGKIIQRSTTAFSTGGGTQSDFGASSLRQTRAEADLLRQQYEQLEAAARQVASETGDNSRATAQFVTALNAQSVEQRGIVEDTDRQIALYGQLGAATNALTSENQQLAAAYRATFQEQASVVAQQEAAQRAFNSFAGVNEVARQNVPTNRASDSARVFEEEMRREAAAAEALAQSEREAAAAARELQQEQEQAARAVQAMEREATQLRAELDPLFAAQQRYNEAVERADRLLQSGAISTDVFNSAQERAQQQLTETNQKYDQAAIAARELERAQEQAAQAAQQLENEAAQLRAELDPLFASQQRFDRELERAERLYRSGAISVNEYTNAQRQARTNLAQSAQQFHALTDEQRRGTDAFGAVTNSLRSQRFAMIQVGQQLQDVTVGFASGQRAATIFAQQLPQLGFAFSGFEGSANKTLNTLGRVGTFLAGPWGVAVFAATTALGFLLTELIKTDDAANKAAESNKTLADELDFVASSYDNAVSAARAYNAETEQSAQTALQLAQAASLAANALLDQARAQRANLSSQLDEQLNGEVEIVLGTTPGASVRRDAEINRSPRIAQLKGLIADNDAQLADLRKASANTNFDLATEQAKIQGDAAAAIAEGYAIARQELRGTISDTKELRDAIIKLNSAEKAELDSLKKTSPNGRTRRRGRRDNSAREAQRETERLSRVSDQAAEQIRRINEQFDDQPRLVDQSARAVRQLDSVLAELDKPENSAVPRLGELIEEYKEARELAANAVSNQIERDFQDDERRLEVQRLIAEGREYEAQILERINAAEQQFGLQARLDDLEDQAIIQNGILEDTESTADEHEAARSALAGISSEMADIRGDQADIAKNAKIVTDETIKNAENQQILNEQQQRYLQTLGGIRTELEGFFNGEGADFSGLFQRLRSQTLVENIFGDSLRDLENSVTGRRGPVGQAVDDLAKETGNVENQMASLADVTGKAVAQISAATGVSRFSSVASNDNGFDFSGASEIAVNGVRSVTARQPISLSEFTRNASETITLPLIDALNDLLGTQFFTRFEGVFQSGLEGLFRAGPIGGILGTLEGLTEEGGLASNDTLNGLFGEALKGAQTGQQTNAILNSLGIRTSNTGSTLGGAAGSLTGLPGGDIIGSLIGGVVGGLFRGSRRASATIGGIGSDLQIGSVTGNNAARQDEATSLLGQVIDNIDRIANQLNANVNAGRGSVSLGFRNDEIRLDTLGQGRTRGPTGDEAENERRGLINFRDDAEGAILAATLDLIQDGVLEGLRRGTEQLLRQADNIEEGLRDALEFEGVFRDLAQARDPLQFALDELDREFTDLTELFTRAGASAEEFADLEELYGIRRREVLEDVGEEFIGTLRDFLSELTTGDNGLSLRDRRNAALQEFNPLAEAIERGERVDYDEFTAAAQAVLQIERDLFGSQSPYFDRLRDITDLTRDALGREQDIVDGASEGGLFGINGGAEPLTFEPTTNAINAMNDNVAGILREINNNIINGNGRAGTVPVSSGGGGRFTGSGFGQSTFRNALNQL